MIESMRIQEFLDVLSSKEPVPGGGGASALAGALGNALGQMVSNQMCIRDSLSAPRNSRSDCLTRMLDAMVCPVLDVTVISISVPSSMTPSLDAALTNDSILGWLALNWFQAGFN